MEQKIRHYLIEKEVGKGGMGEVFLAKDTICGRKVALKKIRDKLLEIPAIKSRFLREARIAAELSHPAIIPIYEIIQEKNSLFYTMPYVEGESLKEIVKKSRFSSQSNQEPHPVGSSLFSLLRIFLNVCQAIAYTHSRGILHRDIKLENILVGKYDEVRIIDWGLAQFIGEVEEEEDVDLSTYDNADLTRPGKVVGTLNYMAPERAKGSPGSIQTEVYALGVCLYSLLSLHPPFRRTTLAEFRKRLDSEKILDPREVAPTRDIPDSLAEICLRTLHPNPEKRYLNVEELISDLRIFMDGTPKWAPVMVLNPKEKEGWEFQENIMLAKHLALSQTAFPSEWVSLMIAKKMPSAHAKLEARIRFQSKSRGVGFLFHLPSAKVQDIEKGYLFWLGHQECKLFRGHVELKTAPQVVLKKKHWHDVTIERSGNLFVCRVDGKEVLSYLSYFPSAAGYLGIVQKDGETELQELKLFEASPHAEVSCLAVPDTLLGYEHFADALKEYEKISSSFAGRSEAREALFRSGLTLIEMGKKHYAKAHKKFSQLHGTITEPLEYLGKALIYEREGDLDEERKCFELSLVKFKEHTLFPLIVEQIALRLHQSARQSKKATYTLAFLALRYLPHLVKQEEHKELLDHLEKHFDYFPSLKTQDLKLHLAYYLASVPALVQIQNEATKKSVRADAQFALLNLHAYDQIDLPEKEILPALYAKNGMFKEGLEKAKSDRIRHFLFCEALDQGKFAHLEQFSMPEETALWTYLLQNKTEEAKKILKNSGKKFPFLYSCARGSKLTLEAEGESFEAKRESLRKKILYFHCTGDEKEKRRAKAQLKHVYP